MFGKEYVAPFQMYLSLSICPLPRSKQILYKPGWRPEIVVLVKVPLQLHQLHACNLLWLNKFTTFVHLLMQTIHTRCCNCQPLLTAAAKSHNLGGPSQSFTLYTPPFSRAIAWGPWSWARSEPSLVCYQGEWNLVSGVQFNWQILALHTLIWLILII